MSILYIWPEVWAQGLWPGQSPDWLLLEAKLAHNQHTTLLREGSWEHRGRTHFLTHFSAGFGARVWVLLLGSRAVSMRQPKALYPWQGRGRALLPLPKSWEALRSWAVPPLSCCFLWLMQTPVLTLHQSIWAHLRSRKAGSLLLRRETSVSLPWLRSMTMFI